MTTEIFIEKANLKHNKKYDYSLSVFTHSHDKIKITCPTHGVFEQKTSKHLEGKGCLHCSYDNKKSTPHTIIKKFNSVHNGKFDYSLMNYQGYNKKIKIICPIHNTFEQTPANHLKYGCQKCSGNFNINNDDFINQANEKHKNFYSYKESLYKTMKEKIIIICPIHGNFKQTPEKHLKGQGCLICSGKNKKTTGTFIKEANEIHNYFYSYEETNYIQSHKNICITCPIHGLFKQTPTNHLTGKGCPNCAASKGEKVITKFLKSNNINFKPQYTFNDLKYKNLLRFDFGVMDNTNNLKFLIEFNGIQHYTYTHFFHKDLKHFNISCLKDKLKKEYCVKNNIKCYIINHDDNINEKLLEIPF